MSTDYHYQVYTDGRSTLQVNFTGIRNGETDIESLGMAIFAYDSVTGSALFNETLNFSQIKGLYEHLNQISIIRDGARVATGKFVEADENVASLIQKIGEIDGDALTAILNTIETDEKVVTLLRTLSAVELDSIAAAHKHSSYKRAYEDLLELLELEEAGDIVNMIKDRENLSAYMAGQPEKIFQNWIEANLWVFGVEYSMKHDARTIAFFSEADILMESLDGYLDLIELKRPALGYELFKYDTSHKCYYPSKALSEVIGQSLFYLQKMDEFKLNLEKEYKVKIIRPRIKIIAGRTVGFNEDQNDALRMLNANLNHIQIYSYDYILSCAKKILSSFED